MKCFNYILDPPNSFFKIIITLLISLGFFLNNVFIAVVDGSSMEDTIHHGDVLIINKKSYSTSSPERYDIVNIYAPCKYDNFLVKRIIGLPGDTIEINDSIVYINGNKISEPYIKEEMNLPYYLKLKIPKDKFFVMGDNRNISLDSRYFGLVQGTDIQGKVIFKYCCENRKFKLF
ncbi:signal peptidase I [Clostridium perfringens]|uniref:signal peptidase I n=1 Tax=Clostridium perfringens TaxID=1502 RepID=UPI0018E49C6E|nr:signal peptidase I [Clostridium perfringens]MBI6037953.1 signal peptidase I [Clostridium perfringens]